MKRITPLNLATFSGILLLTLFQSILVSAQNIGDAYPDARETLIEGIEQYGEDKYTEAIEKFLLINENDSFYHQAVYELALTYRADKQYEKAREKALEGLRANTLLERDFIVVYADVLSDLKQTDSAIKVLDYGLSKYPYFTRFASEKGVVHGAAKNWDEALKCYTEAIKMNVYYPYAHFRVGIIAANAQKPALALMALHTYCIVNTNQDQVLNVIGIMEKIANNEYNPDSFLIDEKNITLAKDLEDIDLIIHSKAALSNKYKGVIKQNFQIVKQLQVLCEKLPDDYHSDNALMEFYVNLHKDIWNNKLYAGSALYNLRFIDNKKTQAEIKSNTKAIDAYKSFVVKRFNEMRNKKTIVVDGKPKEIHLWYGGDGVLKAIGDEDEQGNNIGLWVFFGNSGHKSAEGSFVNGKKDGLWTFYHDGGQVQATQVYKDGKANGALNKYYVNGAREEISYYEDEALKGEVQLFNKNNTLKVKASVNSNSKVEGIRYNYSELGLLSNAGEIKNGMNEGWYKTYHPTGEVNMETTCVQDYFSGPVTFYNTNGSVRLTGTYAKGNRDGDWKWVYPNGTVETTGSYNNGKETGLWKYYYEDGTLQKEENYENGTKKGSYKYYDAEGKAYAEIFVKGGKIDAYKYFDKDGKVIAEGKTSGGKLHYVFYSAYRNRIIEGDYVNGQEEGTWKYYYENGALEYELPYTKGKREGIMKYYYKNGKENYQVMYENDERRGFYKSLFSNGNVQVEGYYRAGKRYGTWIYYRPNGNLNTREFYIEDEIRGKDYDYAPDGAMQGYAFYDQGFFNNYFQTDTTGEIYHQTNLSFGTGLYELYTPTRRLTYRGLYKGGVKDSLHTHLHANGKVNTSEWFHMGKEYGDYRSYYENGKVKSAGINKTGEQDSTWNYYNKQGGLSKRVEFKEGSYSGKYTTFHNNGKTEAECTYRSGILNGPYKLYSNNGILIFDGLYAGGVLLSYTWLDKDGKLLPRVTVKDETADIITYYPNGTIALKYAIDHGYIEGAYLRNYENGKPEAEATYADNEAEGVYKMYYPNGNLKSKDTYLYDELNGVCYEYHENGKVAEETYYIFGYKHGTSKTYDTTGKQTGTAIYYYGKKL